MKESFKLFSHFEATKEENFATLFPFLSLCRNLETEKKV